MITINNSAGMTIPSKFRSPFEHEKRVWFEEGSSYAAVPQGLLELQRGPVKRMLLKALSTLGVAMRKNINTAGLALLVCSLACALYTDAEASSFKVIHLFAGGSGDGSNPNDVFVWDADHLFLSTNLGGQHSAGTVSWVHKDGSVTILHSFGQSDPFDGEFPTGPLRLDHAPDGSRTLLGTTSAGGQPNYGTIFAVTFDGTQYSRYYDFQGSPLGDGRAPQGGLDPYGGGVVEGYYGTTTDGGDAGNDGTIFTFSGYPHYSYSVFHRFNRSDGANPYADTDTYGVDGVNTALWTTASDGGAKNLGTVTQVDPSGNAVVLHSFAGSPSDGAYPEGTLVTYKGFLYGTTVNGGSDGLGTIFRIKQDGSGYAVLYSFKGVCCGRSDGSFPHAGLRERKGYFYGTTINGGSAADDGTVYKFDPNTGLETVLHAFTGSDGAHPFASLGYRRGKTLYGTTSAGGPHNNGALFKLTVD